MKKEHQKTPRFGERGFLVVILIGVSLNERNENFKNGLIMLYADQKGSKTYCVHIPITLL